MAQLTLVFNILKHDIVLQFGAGVTPEDDDDHKELMVVESSGDHSVRQVGFVRNDDEEGEEDDRVVGYGIGPVGSHYGVHGRA